MICFCQRIRQEGGEKAIKETNCVDDLSHKKKYCFQTENGTRTEVGIEAKIKDLDRADLEEILHEFASCTHNFYLSLGGKIAGDVQV